MNCQVDVVIVGDSVAGNKAVKAIASNNIAIKVFFISREFKSSTTKDFLNVEYIKEEVVFTDYKNRLFCCYLKNGDRIYCTHLIIASGLKYSPLLANNKKVLGVLHNIDDVPKGAKYQPAVVVGKDRDEDVKFALAVAKKYKQVYFCTKGFTFLDTSKSNVKKLDKTENLVILPNSAILKVSRVGEKITKVELDNYSTINCSAIYAKTDASPDTDFVSNKLFNKDEAGYIEISANAESTLVPKCFAVGDCAKKSTNKMIQLMLDSILKDF